MKTKNLWTIAGIALMATILFSTAFLGIMPTLIQSQALLDAKVSNDQDNIARKAFLAKLQASSRDKDKLIIDLAQNRQLFPPRLANVEIMDELNAISEDTGVEVTNLSTSNPQHFVAPTAVANSAKYANALAAIPAGTLFVSEMSISLTGTLSQINAALMELRTGPRYVLVYHVVIPEKSSDTPGVYAADINTQVFMLANKYLAQEPIAISSK